MCELRKALLDKQIQRRTIMSLDEQIKLKNAYCQLIVDLGFDYDGYNSIESLKSLIDELVGYAQKAIDNDDKTAIYVDEDGHEQNILLEDIKD